MAATDLSKRRVSTTEAPWVRRTLITIALLFLLLFLVFLVLGLTAARRIID